MRTKRTAVTDVAMEPPAGGVSIRMYRQGLGDCFLLAFHRENDRPFFMLIDCGVILGTKDPSTILTKVVDHIHKTTNGNLDLLVITHEHWDHISGFVDAKPVFDQFKGKIAECWMAWTEKPGDDAALQLQSERRRRATALQAFADQYRDSTTTTSVAAGRVDALLAFHALGAAKGSGTTSEALQNVRELVEREPEYLKPGGAPRELARLPGVRFFVLGPPLDPKDIRKVRPSTVTPETYHRFDRLTFSAESAFFAAALDGKSAGLFEDPNSMEAQSRPFSANEAIDERVVLGTMRGRLTKEKRAAAADLRTRYCRRGEAWRAIGQDWLNTASVLALQLDNQTNNTSLALAIELSDGRVLLFPGDAQVGSWLSWHKLSWTVRDGDGTREMKVGELLSKTALYKVSHHGSHNATLSDLGLRKMTSEDLVTMIPVDERVARRTKHWDMPFGPLLRDLRQRSQQRVMQVAPIRRTAQIPTRAPRSVPAGAWRRFRGAVREDPLFWEYSLAPSRD